MDREIIAVDVAPAPVGPYSQAVRYGNLIFLSGQISADAETGEIIRQDVAGQTRTILSTVKRILESQGSSIDSILKCNIHLSDASHFSAMNTAYASFFGNSFPARVTVSGVQLYDGVDVEIDVVAGV